VTPYILVNIEIFGLFRQFFIELFQHNQQYDTLLPITPCPHKLKAGIAYSAVDIAC
jgi:hypothetical protein